jgi:putative colanic acid biosynthesis acetyltransferase WcaF
MKLDIAGTRSERPYRSTEYVARVLWTLAYPLFRCSPRIAFAWRAFLLRRFGARIGQHVHIYPRADIELPWMLVIDDFSSVADGARIYNLGPVHIGKRATISYGAHICAGTHDYEKATFPLLRVPIEIGDDAWICADAFLAPGVSVGIGAVVAARAVVVDNVPPWTVVAGHPARVVKPRTIAS